MIETSGGTDDDDNFIISILVGSGLTESSNRWRLGSLSELPLLFSRLGGIVGLLQC
jgi:hypothetical protein